MRSRPAFDSTPPTLSVGSTPPTLSVVIPTFRRVGLLHRCLNALGAQTINPERFEIIVVDDGHETEVLACVASAAAAARGLRLRYLRPEQGRGPAVARNCGWRAAHGEIIVFTDDDTLPDPGWLMQGETALQRHPEWSALCGRIRVPLPHDDLPTDHERMTRGLESAEFATANAFVRRDALVRIGGFDERFARAWREDSDLQFRLMAQVGPVGSAPHAVVLHPARAEAWGVCLRQQRNAFFDALLYKKHPTLYRTRLHPSPPWNDYLIVGLAMAAPLLLWAGSGGAAVTAALLLVGLWLQVALARRRHTTRRPSHVVEMLSTSALIPFLSVYWRLRGAIRFRVMFL